MAQHMAYFFSVFSFHFCVTTNKNNHKSLYIACSHPAQHNYQTGCLLRPLISMIHLDKIKPYSQLHVSMTSLTNFSTLMAMHHPDHFFPISHWLPSHDNQVLQSTHWSPIHMAHYNFPAANYHSRNSQPYMPCDNKITHYIYKTLLDFVDIYFITHCNTVPIFPLYFYDHI